MFHWIYIIKYDWRESNLLLWLSLSYQCSKQCAADQHDLRRTTTDGGTRGKHQASWQQNSNWIEHVWPTAGCALHISAMYITVRSALVLSIKNVQGKSLSSCKAVEQTHPCRYSSLSQIFLPPKQHISVAPSLLILKSTLLMTIPTVSLWRPLRGLWSPTCASCVSVSHSTVLVIFANPVYQLHIVVYNGESCLVHWKRSGVIQS